MLAVTSDDDAKLVVVAKDDSCCSLLFSRSRRLRLSRLHTIPSCDAAIRTYAHRVMSVRNIAMLNNRTCGQGI